MAFSTPGSASLNRYKKEVAILMMMCILKKARLKVNPVVPLKASQGFKILAVTIMPYF
jgi:hypothetical protein